MRTPAFVIGAILLVVGMFIAGGKLFYHDTDKVLDLGKVEVNATHEKRAPLNWGYILIGAGAIAIIAGAVAKRT